MPMTVIDSHAHLDLPEFKTDLAEVLERAFRAGVKHIVSVGIDMDANRRAVAIARENSAVYAAIGCHPHEAMSFDSQYYRNLEALASESKVVAIGETGLDYFRNTAPPEIQLHAFREQLKLAENLNLPVIIHARQAEQDAVSTLQDWTLASKRMLNRPPGVIHCFSGSTEVAETYLGMGFMLSLGAYIGYPSSRVLQQVVRKLPLERLMLETDCPFLPPQSQRGKRNEPSYVISTALELARLKGISVEEVAAATSSNTSILFGLPG
jgi:TatD DNase family protein